MPLDCCYISTALRMSCVTSKFALICHVASEWSKGIVLMLLHTPLRQSLRSYHCRKVKTGAARYTSQKAWQKACSLNKFEHVSYCHVVERRSSVDALTVGRASRSCLCLQNCLLILLWVFCHVWAIDAAFDNSFGLIMKLCMWTLFQNCGCGSFVYSKSCV